MSQWDRASYKTKVLATRPNATLRKTPYAESLGLNVAPERTIVDGRRGPMVFRVYDGDELLALPLRTAMDARSAWAYAHAYLTPPKEETEVSKRPYFSPGKKTFSERDRIEQAIADDPLFYAEEIVDIKRALERIESFAHEDGSLIAHRALQSKLFTGEPQ